MDEKRLDRLEDKLDKVLDKQTDIQVDMASISSNIDKNTADLSEHIRRTELLEVRVDALEEPGIVRKYLKTWVVGLLGAASACAGLAKYFGLL